MLIALGWVAVQTQEDAADFELIVDAPAGETHVECLSGCSLLWIGRGIPQDAEPKTNFSFRCGGPGVERCSSFRIGGWLTPR
jgi:hypothetical protein